MVPNIFNGRVRSEEEGKIIKALEYEQYEIESELRSIAEESLQISISDLFCILKIGKVLVGNKFACWCVVQTSQGRF